MKPFIEQNKFLNHEVTIALDYDDTNFLNFLFNFSHFFDCSNQTSKTSVRKKYLEADEA